MLGVPDVPADQVHGTYDKHMLDLPNQVRGMSGKVPDVPDIIPVFCCQYFYKPFRCRRRFVCFVSFHKYAL